MKQFKTIMGFELKSFIRNKGFIFTTLFLVVALGVLMFLPNILSVTSSSEEETEKPVMLVNASDGALADFVHSAFGEAFADYDVRLTDDGEDAIREQVISGEAECAFVMESLTSYTYYVNDLTMTDSNTAIADSVLQNVYRMSMMMQGGMTPDQASDVLSVTVEGQTEKLGKDQMENYWYTYIMIFALYMVIILYGQMVATSVATEKSSRAMEVLVTSADPVAMMFGKVLSACLAGFVQLAVVFGSAILFYNINKDEWADIPIISSIFDMPPSLLAFMLIFFVLGFLIYAFLYGAVGSTTSKLEDVSSAVLPLTYLFIFAFAAVMFSMSAGSVDNVLMTVCSYVPFTSPMAMFTRIAMSSVPWYEIVISVVILIGSVIGVGVLSAKIYRAGVLMYGKKPNLFETIRTVLRS